MMDIHAYSHLWITDDLPLEQAKKRYFRRRQQLLEAVGTPILLVGIEHGPNHTHVWASTSRFVYQEPSLVYYMGINQVRTALFCAPGHPDTLFIDPKDLKKEFWEGLRFGCGTSEAEAEITQVTGITSIRPYEELALFIQHFLMETLPENFHTLWHISTRNKVIKDSNYEAKTKLLRWIKACSPGTQLLNLSDVMWMQRLKLDETDVEMMTKANEITSRAFKLTAKKLKAMSSETHISAELNYQIAKQTYFGNSFPSIVASGRNATVLHYIRNNAPVCQGNLILLDFGARWQSMNADISRVLPLSGKFNALQKALYSIVLTIQKEVEAEVKPGVTFAQLNEWAWKRMYERVSLLITEHQGKMTLNYDVQPHNIGHFLGSQVHDGDPSRRYRDTPFVAGNCITNEPGLYGYFEATIDGAFYGEWIGIRIEDNLLITPTGCRNLSAGCPKEIRDVEDYLSQVFDD